MARISEKYNDSCLKMFKLLELLMQGEVEFKDVISIFADEKDGINSNSHVLLNKYMNTLKIFGVKVNKEKNRYYLLNMPFNIDFSEEEVKSIGILKSAAEVMASGKLKNNLLKLIKDIELRYSENSKSFAAKISGDANFDFSFYYTQLSAQLLKCEAYCKEKQKLEIIYLSNNEEYSIICSPKEMKYQNRKVCLSVYNQLARQILDIPIDKIKSVKQLPTLSNAQSEPTSVVYKLRNELAKSYKLKDWEYSNGYDAEGNQIIVNINEDYDVLLTRLMRYGENCIICTPKFLRERILDMINKSIENYDS